MLIDRQSRSRPDGPGFLLSAGSLRRAGGLHEAIRQAAERFLRDLPF